MGKITAWECERTGVLFRLEREYKSHLADLRRIDAREEKERQRIAARDALDAAIYRCQSFAEVEDWLVANWDRLQKEHGGTNERSHVKSIRFHGMSYSDSQSNTHSAPRGMTTNWGCASDKPRGYPGWYGRVSIEYTGHHRTSDVLKAINVCTGSGGCGSFDVTLWAQDFPCLHGSTFAQYPSMAALTQEASYRIASYIHDVCNIDRVTTHARARTWHDLEKKISELSKANIKTEFRQIGDHIDRLARAFGNTSWRYYVGERLSHGKADLFDGRRRHGHAIPILPLGERGWQMRDFLMEEPDMAVEWKLRGDISASTPIIDLKERAERLLLEGKIASMSPDL